MAKASEIHCQHLDGTRNTRYSLSSVGSAPLALAQTPFCSEQLRAGRGVKRANSFLHIHTPGDSSQKPEDLLLPVQK